jgi:hypothetical protein
VTEPDRSAFGDVVENYINNISSLNNSLPLIMAILQTSHFQSIKKFKGLLDEYGIKKEEDDEKTSYWIPSDNRKEISNIESEMKSAGISLDIIPKNFVVSLVSQFDAFLGNLIRTIFAIKPEKLNSSEKTLKYSQIIKMESIEDIKKYIIEKEIETVLRKNHEEHFDWLEKKLNMPLRKGLESWSDFIELTERRNLFVHCNGIVSSQYINSCNNNNVNLTCELGDRLKVTPDYFKNSYSCIFEIGVKLAHVIWRKLLPEEREEADYNLIEAIFNLITKQDYEIAIILSEFATSTLKKFYSTETKLMFIINKAQAYKWNGNEEKCIEIIDKIDWTAYKDLFNLAYNVLANNFEEATNIMPRLSADTDFKKTYYKDWPLFKELIKTEEFKETYYEIYNEEFQISDEGEVVVEDNIENEKLYNFDLKL